MISSSSVAKPALPKPVIHFGNCELRLDTRELLINGQPRPVRRRVFDLITYLISQRPRAVPHAEVLKMVWQRAAGSTQALARSIMEARRACDDAADNPRLFVSVHGVGYRFAGTVTEGASPPMADSSADAGGMGEVRDLLQQARRAFDLGNFEQCQFLAERALVQASQAQSQTERVHALVMCSSLAMRRGTAAAAAKLAAQALQIARGEGQAQLIAKARMAVGYVHLVAGDRAVAIEHFEACREPLSAPGCEVELQICLMRLVMAFRDTGKPETGLEICRRTLALARQIKDQSGINSARTNEVMLLIRIGDEQSARGLAPQARATFEEALALIDPLLHDLTANGAPERQSALGNRAFVLQRLGRLDEAWQMLAEVEKGLNAAPQPDSPLAAERQRITAMLRATLLADSGRFEDALEEIEASVQGALSQHQTGLLPTLFGMASGIAQRAGLLEQALDWARRQLEAQTAQQSGNAATLTSILEAELNHDDLKTELQRARDQVSALLLENADLRASVFRLDGAVPVSPATGLAPSELVGTIWSAAHARACSRSLPMFLALLELVNLAALSAAHAPEVISTLMHRAAEVLRGQADIAHPAVEAGSGQAAFHIRDAGGSRAAEVCELVLQRLRSQDWSLLGLDLHPVWHCTLADAAVAASPERCVQQLAERALEQRLASVDSPIAVRAPFEAIPQPRLALIEPEPCPVALELRRQIAK